MAVQYNDGFAGTVSFACSGLPSESTCTAPSLNASGETEITITTKGSGFLRAEKELWLVDDLRHDLRRPLLIGRTLQIVGGFLQASAGKCCSAICHCHSIVWNSMRWGQRHH